jgi:predicted amidohydrolase YtcJ
LSNTTTKQEIRASITRFIKLVTLPSQLRVTSTALVNMLFTHATVVTVNANREIVLDGAILVRDSRITDIGKTETLVSKYEDEDTYDLSGHIICPGLISTHMHTAQTLLRGTH